MEFSPRVQRKSRLRNLVAGAAVALAVVTATAGAATLDPTPNPAAANGGEVWVLGCGYVVGKSVDMAIYGPDAIISYRVAVDASGCVYPSRFWTSSPGEYGIDARQSLRGKKQVLMGAATLMVE
jgi:hypothetical protein